MIKVDDRVLIKALPDSLEGMHYLKETEGTVTEVDPWIRGYTMYSVKTKTHGVLVFGPKHIQLIKDDK